MNETPYLDGLFGWGGFAATFFAILSVKLCGAVGKGPYFLDPVALNVPAIQLFVEKGLVSIHPHAGFLFIAGVFNKLFGSFDIYGRTLIMNVVIGMAPMAVTYASLRAWTQNKTLAWMSAFTVGVSAPALFVSYMVYGTTLAHALVFGAMFAVMRMAAVEKGIGVRTPLLAGLLSGAAYTCHESALVMSCAIFGAMFLNGSWKLYSQRSGYMRFAAGIPIYIAAFSLPIIFFNNAVPLYYLLAKGVDYKREVANYSLDFGFSGAHNSYLWSLIEPWKRYGEIMSGIRFANLFEMIYLMAGWPVLLFATLGTVYCARNRQTRFMLLIPLSGAIFVVGAAFSPVFVLRLVVSLIMMISVLAGCGVYAAWMLADNFAGTGIRWRNGAQMSVAAVLLVWLALPMAHLVANSGTAYSAMMDYGVRNNWNFRRVLSFNHLLAWHYLKYGTPLNFLPPEEAIGKYDYLILEPGVAGTLMPYNSTYAAVLKGSAPVAVFDNPYCKHDYFPAEGGLDYLRIVRNEVPKGLSRDKLYVFKLPDAK